MKDDHSSKNMTYANAGVNIDAGNDLIERIKPYAKRTLRPEVMNGIGGFGALCQIPEKYQQPILVSGTDGVGTKLKLAFELNKHDTIGIDLVAMCVNDILVCGAEPLFFLDYFATSRLNPDIAGDVIKGISEGCLQANCSLIGGETAEMPGLYQHNDYDLAGFCVGVVEKNQRIDGSQIKTGNSIIGIASSGPHSNGYSLINKLISDKKISLDTKVGEKSLADILLTPTQIYCKPMLALLTETPLNGIAHITGGGLVENPPRVLPKDLQATIDLGSWPTPIIFDWLQKIGNISDMEMLRTFNCGIGMVLYVDESIHKTIIEQLAEHGLSAWKIGEIINANSSDDQTVIFRHH